MSINRVRLHYMPSVSKTPPIGKIIIPSAHLEQIDVALKEKLRQNELERIMSRQGIEDLVCR